MAKALVMSRRNDNKKKRRKASAEELAERQQMVMRLRLRGLSYRDIAKELGVGYMTVKRDLERIKEETHSRISKFDRDYALGKTLSVYEQIEKESWEQYHGCAPGSSGRAQFLNLVRTARNDQAKLLMDVGLIGKAPQQVQHKVEADAILKNWTSEAKQLVAMAIIKTQLPEPGEPVAEDDGSNGQTKPVIELPPSTQAPAAES